MTPEQAVTPSTRSGAGLSERHYQIIERWRLLLLVLIPTGLLMLPLAHLTLALNNIASAIKNLKPEMKIVQNPTRVEVIQPKPLLPEVK